MTGILLVDKPEGHDLGRRDRAGEAARSAAPRSGTSARSIRSRPASCRSASARRRRSRGFSLVEEKAYEGTIRLGSATDTLDRTGTPVETASVPRLERRPIGAAVAARFAGRQQQIPPMYSALKRDGVPLYQLARRASRSSARRARSPSTGSSSCWVTGNASTFRRRLLEGDVRARAGGGHRSALGTVAHLERLRRTRVGPFRVDDAATLDGLLAASESGPLPRSWPCVTRSPATRDLRGRARRPRPVATWAAGTLARLPQPRTAGETALLVDDGGNVAGVIGGRRSRPCLAPRASARGPMTEPSFTRNETAC